LACIGCREKLGRLDFPAAYIGLKGKGMFRSSRAVFIIGLLGVILLGLADTYSGHELGFFLFYSAPVALVAWRAGAERPIGEPGDQRNGDQIDQPEADLGTREIVQNTDG
jgi:hypothetical protein